MASILEGMPCRILHRQWVQPTATATGHWGETVYENATFLDFSTDYEELGENVGQFPVGIVLLESGQLASAPVTNIEILSGEEDDEHSETMGDTKDPNDSVHI